MKAEKYVELWVSFIIAVLIGILFVDLVDTSVVKDLTMWAAIVTSAEALLFLLCNSVFDGQEITIREITAAIPITSIILVALAIGIWPDVRSSERWVQLAFVPYTVLCIVLIVTLVPAGWVVGYLFT